MSNQVRSFSELVAKCPSCSRSLVVGEHGIPICRNCEQELDIDVEAVLELKGKILDQDNEVHVLVPGAEKILRRLFERV